MKNIDKETLKTAANKLMFEMSEEQYNNLLNEFGIITTQMELIGKIEGVDNASPMTFPFDVTSTYIREDEATEPLDRDVALKNAKDVVDGQIRLPRVVK